MKNVTRNNMMAVLAIIAIVAAIMAIDVRKETDEALAATEEMAQAQNAAASNAQWAVDKAAEAERWYDPRTWSAEEDARAAAREAGFNPR